MKVHPGMSMKTNKARFQVSGARCQEAARLRIPARSQDAGSRNTEIEGSSGDGYENKERQVSGVRCQVLGGGKPAVFRSIARCGTPETPKMKVHPGMSMKTNKGRFQVSGARC